MAEEHVRGRMPLESNPGNRNPAIPPVYDTTGKEDYRRVTPDNPLPTKDKDLDERLTAIENKLDSVIENGAINTQLSGSKVEQDVIIAGGKRDEIVILPRKVRTNDETVTFNIPGGVTSVLFVHIVYQVSGKFDEGEGHKFYVAPYEGTTGRVLFGTAAYYDSLMDYSTRISASSFGSFSFLFNPSATEMPNPKQDVAINMPVVFNDMRSTLRVRGQFEENEGIDSEIICRFNYN